MTQANEFVRGVGRSHALEQLAKFSMRAPDYGSSRNYVLPTHANVSRLSAFLRYRAITEAEVTEDALRRHRFQTVEKWIQEVVWRTYWKGWLELRPTIWNRYLDDCRRVDPSAQYETAVSGKTGLACFDDWVAELKATGFLHNHARMWFASVWIFTLELPWQLGAKFFYDHLLDGDAASNTLSWRWVGGIQTRGKHYVATPENIKRYSEGRWSPLRSEFNLNPEPLPWEGLPDPINEEPLRANLSAIETSESAFLLHDDDLSFWEGEDRLIFLLPSPSEHTHGEKGKFLSELRADRQRATGAQTIAAPEALLEALRVAGKSSVALALPRIGFEKTAIDNYLTVLESNGIRVFLLRREWDAKYHPLARWGFFRFWKTVRADLGSVSI